MKRKLTAIFLALAMTLALVLTICLTACDVNVSTKNTETPFNTASPSSTSDNSDNIVAPSALATETVSGGTAARFVSMLSGDTYHIKTHSITAGVEINVEVYLKNSMYAQIYNSPGISTIIISRDNKTYTFFVDDKSYHVDDMPMDTTSSPYYAGDLTLSDSGTAEYGGKTLPYDEYTDTFGDKKQYFTDGNTLVGIREIDSFDTQDTDVLALDQNVPDSAFTLPDGYTPQATPTPAPAGAFTTTLTTSLTLAQVEQNARDAGLTVYGNFDYEAPDGAPAAPDTGFTFSHPDLFYNLYVLEFVSESDAKAYADAEGNDSNHEYVQGKLVLEIGISPFDDFTADQEAQMVSALFK